MFGVLAQILWALCVYVEAVSVLPQLRMMQKAKVVEKFTAHYVFALGLSRFISCAHWILQLVDGDFLPLLQVGALLLVGSLAILRGHTGLRRGRASMTSRKDASLGSTRPSTVAPWLAAKALSCCAC